MIAITRVVVIEDTDKIYSENRAGVSMQRFLDSETYRRRKENVWLEINRFQIKFNPLTFKKPLHEKALMATMISQWKKQQN